MGENKVEDVMELGKWLGRREAFALVAGRCSAADAKCLRDLRESKKYKELGLTWEECCKRRLGISRSVADQNIRNLDEFGPDYFLVAQVTGIPANEYRRIRGAVSNHKLLCAGEEIPIAVENAPRLAAAIETLRQSASSPPAPETDIQAQVARSFTKAERAVRAAVAELGNLNSQPLELGDRIRLRAIIGEAEDKLHIFGLQSGSK